MTEALPPLSAEQKKKIMQLRQQDTVPAQLTQQVEQNRIQRELQAQQAQRTHQLKQYASIGGLIVGTILIILAFSFYYGDHQKHKKMKSTSNTDFHPGRDIGLLVGGVVLVALGWRSVNLPPASK